MKKISYTSPVIEMIEVEIEKGFATSSTKQCCWGEVGEAGKIINGADYLLY